MQEIGLKNKLQTIYIKKKENGSRSNRSRKGCKASF